jgi:gamma-glutamyltranspeptidase / glutathione hydrolase
VHEFARFRGCADNARMDWSFTYPSQRMPVLAANAVATSQPLATQAALDVLREGGTAADAIVCAAATLTVVEPVANGIGSDAFALLWGDGLTALNASGRSPAGQPRSAFDGLNAMPRTGWGAVTVPGCVSAWRELHARAGRLPFDRLLQPAIAYARNGYLVSPMTAASWARSVARFQAFPSWMSTFAPQGRAPAVGELVRLPDHARTLEAIARTGGDAFYTGELAARMDAAARAEGGALRADDLAAHRPMWVEPWSVDYRGYTLHELPPNGQGLAALLALAVLERFDLGRMGPDSPDWVHVQVEAMKAAFANAHAYIGDPEQPQAELAQALLRPEFVGARAASLDMSRAAAWTPQPLPRSSTVYLCAADAEGHMVSYIQSNYEGFGSGVVVPGTGIALQNRGAGFVLTPGHPNEYAPAKRPYHTIIPGFLTRHGSPIAAFGVMGGAMQPQGHVQVVVRLVDQQLNPQSAIDAPRWQVLESGELALEPGFPPATVDALAARGHRIASVSPAPFFGGGQMVWRLDAGYAAASDPRRDGQAAGF